VQELQIGGTGRIQKKGARARVLRVAASVFRPARGGV
jgi:hypothetical protein